MNHLGGRGICGSTEAQGLAKAVSDDADLGRSVGLLSAAVKVGGVADPTGSCPPPLVATLSRAADHTHRQSSLSPPASYQAGNAGEGLR